MKEVKISTFNKNINVNKDKDSISSFIDGDRRMKDENLASALMADLGMVTTEEFHGI